MSQTRRGDLAWRALRCSLLFLLGMVGSLANAQSPDQERRSRGRLMMRS